MFYLMLTLLVSLKPYIDLDKNMRLEYKEEEKVLTKFLNKRFNDIKNYILYYFR